MRLRGEPVEAAQVGRLRVPRQRNALDAAAAAAVRATAVTWDDLVERTKRGEGEASGVLFDRCVDTVYRYAFYRLADQELAEEVVTQAFLLAFRDVAACTWPASSFPAWVLHKAHRVVGELPAAATFELCADPGLVAEAEHLGAGYLDLLGRVRCLPPDLQECIALRYLHHLDVADTARVLGLTPMTVAGLEAAALVELRSLAAAS